MNNIVKFFYLLYALYFPQFILYNIFQSDLILYLFSPYSFFVINVLHRFFITINHNSVSKKTLLTFIIIFFIILNEIYNSFNNNFFIQDSIFKSILYNPLLMSIINYLFLHRNLIDSGLENNITKTFIKILFYIFFIQLTISLLIYFNLLRLNSIANFSFTHDNTGSFYFLFLYIVLLKKNGHRKTIILFICVSIYSLINDCRSVQLCLLIISLYNIFKNLPFRFYFKLNLFFSLPIIILTYLLIYNFNFLEDKIYILNEVANETVMNSDNTAYLKDIDKTIINSQGEQNFSSLSRLGSNYLSYRYFLNSIIFGNGTRFAYNIEFLGNGIHSLFFLVLTTGGIFLLFFLFLFYYTNFNFKIFHFESKVYLVFIFFFVNILTPHIFLFAYLYKQSNEK